MDKTIYTENDFIRFPSNPVYKVVSAFDKAKQKAVAGDIVLWDKQKQEKLLVSLEEFNTTYKDDSNFVGIAVVVVPATHTPDGTIRCVVPKYMGNNAGIVAGYNSYVPTQWSWNVSTSSNIVVFGVGTFKYRIHGTTSYATCVTGGFPSNNKTWGPNGGYTGLSLDPLAPLYRTQPYCPSPYAEDGFSKNPDFFINEQGVNGGFCDYMDGRSNTVTISGVSNLTAAWFCREFASEGIKKGDCYLPAVGEGAYLVTRHAQIVDGMLAINPELDRDISGISTTGGYMLTCTESIESSKVYGILWGGGSAMLPSKTAVDSNHVLPFVAF